MKRKIAILLSGIMVASAVPMTASAARLDPDKVLNASFSKVNEPIDIDAYNAFAGSISNYPDYVNNSTDIRPPSQNLLRTLPADGETLTKETLASRKSVVKIDLTENISGSVLVNPTFRVTLENGSFDETYLQNYLYTNTNKDKAVSWKTATANGTATTLTDIYTNIIKANVATDGSDANYVAAPATQNWVEATNSLATQGTKLPTSNVNETKSLILAAIYSAQNKIKTTGNDTITLRDGSTTVTLEPNNPAPFVQVVNDEAAFLISDGQAFAGQEFTPFIDYSALTNAIKDEYVKERTQGYVNPSIDLANIPYTFQRISDKEAIVTVNATLTDSDKKLTFKVPNTTTVDKASLGAIRFTNGSGTTNVTFDHAGITTMKHVVIEGNNGAGGHATIEKEITVENPYIALPLGGVVADSEGPVKAKITADYTDKVTAKEFVLNVGSESGSTSLVYNNSDVRTFEDQVELGKVLVKENSRNTLGKDTDYNSTSKNGVKDSLQFDLKLNSGFKFTNKTISPTSNEIDYKNEIKLALEAASAVSITQLEAEADIKAEYINENHIRITITPKSGQKGLETFGANRQYPIGIAVEKLDIKPVSDNIYGDATITVSGDGINTQSTTVAKREKLGFQLKTLKDPKEIVSGRHYTQDGRNMTDSDNTTVEIQFSEGVPNTLVESRNLDFTLPEGVKIADVEVSDYKNLKDIGDNNFEIINNGRTLRLRRIDNTNNQYGSKYSVADKVNKVASFKMKLDLSVEPGFTGDIKLGVTGGGQSDTVETVVAKAINPVEVKTSTTKVNLGYQDYNTADITITENRPGMLLADREVKLELKAPYGVQEVGFSQAKLEVSGDELSVKDRDFSVSNGVIKFKVDRSSNKNPATITLKNVKIGSTRSVPYGSYNLSLSGDAIINNYQKGGKDDRGYYTPFIYDKDVSVLDNNYNTNISSSTSNSAADTQRAMNGLRVQDKVDHYEIKDYVNVVTETGTFDKTVKVSVGDKTVLIGDQAVDMDVAPYIQASSNSTMVPLRFVSAALGVDTANVTNPDDSNKIAYDVNTKTATIYYGAGTGQKIIQFQAGSNIMTVDGTRIPMEYGVKAEIKDSRMFVPFRALGQALGVNVTWDADSKAAIYNADNARNANNNNTTATESTTQTTTASTTTESTTKSDSTTQSTTASDSTTTESTTAKQ